MWRAVVGNAARKVTRLLPRRSGITFPDKRGPIAFRNYTRFTTETLRAITAAYDAVVARLKLKPADPRTGKLAILIVQLTDAGVVDPEKLADQARVGLK
jgi:hypothetical protein